MCYIVPVKYYNFLYGLQLSTFIFYIKFVVHEAIKLGKGLSGIRRSALFPAQKNVFFFS